jgi:hypothetical protein
MLHNAGVGVCLHAYAAGQQQQHAVPCFNPAYLGLPVFLGVLICVHKQH